jgi:hypothetical protein
VGVLPAVRRVWAPPGQRPTAWVHRRSEWLDVDGCVRPTTGQSWWGLGPTVRTVAMPLALAAVAHDAGIDAQHRVGLVLDGAGWHIATDLVLPAGLDVVVLPATSPELPPVERTWLLLDAPVATRTFADRDALEMPRVDRCQTLRADRATLRSQPCFHWWPSDLAPALLQ